MTLAHRISDLLVAGSNPARHTIFIQFLKGGRLLTFPLNSSCLNCGESYFLERGIVGDTISAEALKQRGIDLQEGVEVFICFECYLEVCL